MSLSFLLLGAAWVTPTLVVSVIALSLTILFFVLNARKERKALGYSVDVRALVEVNPSAPGSVEVLFNGQRVKDPHLIQVEIVNTGRVPIQEGDFARALQVSVPRGAQPLSVTTTSDPHDLDAEVTMDANGDVRLEPLLLNAGDAVTVSVLTRSPPFRGNVVVTGRIVGIKSFKATNRVALSPDGLLPNRLAPLSLVMAIASIAAGLLTLFANENTKVTLKDGRVVCASKTRDAAGGMLVVIRSDDSRRLVYAPDEVTAVKTSAC